MDTLRTTNDDPFADVRLTTPTAATAAGSGPAPFSVEVLGRLSQLTQLVTLTLGGTPHLHVSLAVWLPARVVRSWPLLVLLHFSRSVQIIDDEYWVFTSLRHLRCAAPSNTAAAAAAWSLHSQLTFGRVRSGISTLAGVRRRTTRRCCA
jgi:hypothetical protein